ncbi:MAG: bifunctional (p)ppGpp synthetase/guanosine-3',5'-bis(diphosphate) 3'-pyrophosphohydrolase [Bacteroidales bacterium]|nr:bifunctional (p)ppGpp synthetase/guanosine-3',5'-bis(diphosphate) 3'-pyrophosphohydrolase [Bacteroidales bacterium]
MSTYVPDPELERRTILKKYKELLTIMYDRTSKEQRQNIRKAFALAVNAHRDMRRRSGEPYIYHPIAVAKIVCTEINLGTTSVICALLHDVVEDTDYTLEDIRNIFGDKVAKIIDGLTKIDVLAMNDEDISIQAENFKKILLSMSEDVRVILIKLADRLHNMRTLDAMPSEKQLKIASETAYFYAPIAHRLGLYSIKSELEDFAMQYTDPVAYQSISSKLKESEAERKTLIADFVKPIQQKLKEKGIEAEMSSRVKSIYSIYQKMKKKGIPFEDVYDIFAVRFVFDSEIEDEKPICWAIYTIVTELYRTNAERERNFLTTPKPNGYQALHVTAMSNSGKWIEVQIRSKRMDEIAENGFAAHYKYKEANRTPKEYENRVEDWLQKIREILKSDDVNAVDFLSEVKLNLGLKEVIVFTPKGDTITLPAGATVLDFAYAVHSELGNRCIGAKVNYSIVPVNHILKNGDQVEIITSKKQVPKVEWIEIVQTSKAKEIIRESIKAEQRKAYMQGEPRLKAYFEELGIKNTSQNKSKLQEKLKIKLTSEFWAQIASGKITKEQIRKVFFNEESIDLEEFQKKITDNKENRTLEELIDEELKINPEIFMLDDSFSKIRHITIANCCKPIPGDQVVGFMVSKNEIMVHRVNCPQAIEQMSKYGNRIIKARWRKEQAIAFLSGIKIVGFDRKGLLHDLIEIISTKFEVNMKSINLETKSNVVKGTLMLYIENAQVLDSLIKTLSEVDNIEKVTRIGF